MSRPFLSDNETEKYGPPWQQEPLSRSSPDVGSPADFEDSFENLGDQYEISATRAADNIDLQDAGILYQRSAAQTSQLLTDMRRAGVGGSQPISSPFLPPAVSTCSTAVDTLLASQEQALVARSGSNASPASPASRAAEDFVHAPPHPRIGALRPNFAEELSLSPLATQYRLPAPWSVSGRNRSLRSNRPSAVRSAASSARPGPSNRSDGSSQGSRYDSRQVASPMPASSAPGYFGLPPMGEPERTPSIQQDYSPLEWHAQLRSEDQSSHNPRIPQARAEGKLMPIDNVPNVFATPLEHNSRLSQDQDFMAGSVPRFRVHPVPEGSERLRDSVDEYYPSVITEVDRAGAENMSRNWWGAIEDREQRLHLEYGHWPRADGPPLVPPRLDSAIYAQPLQRTSSESLMPSSPVSHTSAMMSQGQHTHTRTVHTHTGTQFRTEAPCAPPASNADGLSRVRKAFEALPHVSEVLDAIQDDRDPCRGQDAVTSSTDNAIDPRSVSAPYMFSHV